MKSFAKKPSPTTQPDNVKSRKKSSPEKQGKTVSKSVVSEQVTAIDGSELINDQPEMEQKEQVPDPKGESHQQKEISRTKQWEFEPAIEV